MTEQGQRTRVKKRMGELLLEAGIIRPEDLPVCVAEARRQSLRLGEMLVLMRLMSTEDLSNVLQAQTMLEDGEIDEALAVDALKLASRESLDFWDAIDRVREVYAKSAELKRKELARLLDEIVEIEAAKGSDARELEPLLLRAGDQFREFEQYAEAERCYNRAIFVCEHAFGTQDLKVGLALGRLIDLFIEESRWIEAETLAWRAIHIIQEVCGDSHLDTAEFLQKMAIIMEARGRFVEAEQFYLGALRIKENVLGPDHPDLVDQLRRMASFWSKQGQRSQRKRFGDLLVEAGLLENDFLLDAVAKSQSLGIPLGQYLLNQDSIDPGLIRAGLQAQLLIGDGVVPVELALKALRICAKQKMPLNESLEFIGWCPDRLSTRELRALLQTVDELITAERNLGANHCGVALICLRLADAYSEQGRLVEAEYQYKRAVLILERFFGPKDSEVAPALHKLGCLYLKMKRLHEAESLVWRTLEIRQKALGADHIDAAQTLELLGTVKAAQGNHEQAEQFFQNALAINERQFGKDNPRYIDLLDKTADNYVALGKLDLAEPLYVRLVRLLQKDAESGLAVACILDKLGDLYMARGDLANAETQLELALEIRETVLGKFHDEIVEPLTRYAALLKELERESEADQLEERVRLIRESQAMRQDST